MKYYFLFSIIIISLLLAYRPANAQVYNDEIITVQSGTYVNIQGDLYNNTGTVNNAGTIIIAGDYTNEGTFNSVTGSVVKLDGATQLLNGTNPTTFSILEIAGTGDKQDNLDEYIAQELRFTGNKIIIGNTNLTLLPSAVITTPSNAKYVVTNGTGSLVKESVPLTSDFLFPVGDAVSSYKPVTLNNTGVIDTFSVRVMAGVVPTTGTVTTDNECVQYTYLVEESNNGGSNASLKLGWNTADEGTSFDRAFAYMWQNNGSWTNLLGTVGSLSNLPATDYYHQTTGITDFSSNANRFILRSYQAPAIVVSPTDITTCENNTASFSITAVGTGIQYQWQGNCGSGWSDLTNIPPYLGTTTNTLIITDPAIGMNGCWYQCIISNQDTIIVSDSAALTVHLPPHANAGNDTTVIIGNSVQLAATGGTSYVWTPSTYLDDPNVSNPISTPLTDISYIVFVTDANGCSDTDTINVDVDNVEAVFVPTAFAPNGYWQNATLYVSGKGIKELDFVVYDRWGEKIWESDKWNNPADGWDGTYKGNKLSAAVFVYYLKATYYSGEKIEQTGNVTLIR